MAVVSDLYVYPIKSCRGIRVAEWPVSTTGFFADRRWMLVDASGTFATQREWPELARVHVHFQDDELTVTAPGMVELKLPVSHEAGSPRTVQVWQDRVQSSVHDLGSAWFTRYLGVQHELVYMPNGERRQVNPERARAGDLVSFADAYPFLLISEASLADLNARLPEPMAMERFRPNIVITGTEPYAEDDYAQVQIGEITFRGPKRCDRCVVTAVDPETGIRSATGEPLRTLAKYRLSEQKVWFGMNLIHDELGTLRVGDAVRADH